VIGGEVFVLGLAALASFISVIAVYMAVFEKDLVKAMIYTTIQSIAYAFLFYILMAPDIALVYIPVAIGLYPALVLVLISRTEREERG
jgi:energy-converting hydrogenase B subunit D